MRGRHNTPCLIFYYLVHKCMFFDMFPQNLFMGYLKKSSLLEFFLGGGGKLNHVLFPSFFCQVCTQKIKTTQLRDDLYGFFLYDCFNFLDCFAVRGSMFMVLWQWRFCPTVCPGSSSPMYIMSYYIKWVTTSWTCGILYSMLLLNRNT